MPELDYWHWLALGLALMALEILAPSTYLLWMGVAAMGVGALLWLMPGLMPEMQLILFALFSILAIVLGRRYVKKHPIKTDHPTLNVRGAQAIGRILTLDAPIINGVGRARMDDTLWRVLGPDLSAGTRVEVIGVEGTALRVRPLGDDGSGSEGTSAARHDHDEDGGDGGGD